MTLKFVPKPDQPYRNILLYGPPKSGKSAGACSVAGGVLLLNVDLPNASHYARSKDAEGRISEVFFEGLETLTDIYAALAQEQNLIETVVVDPVGELHRRLLEEQSKRAIRPTLPQYGDVSVYVERFCRYLCEAPVNAVIVCHEHPVKDESSGQVERLPYTGTTNPALGQKLLGMVDIVGYTGVIEAEDGSRTYAAQLFSQNGRRGGDRFDRLGDYRTLDLEEWFEVLNAEEAEHVEPVSVG